jgi:hypothetical protein
MESSDDSLFDLMNTIIVHDDSGFFLMFGGCGE